MGICNSSEATAIVSSTTKVILPDGRLQEYDQPVKVSYVVQKEPTCFICNSDDMELNGYVTALNSDEELRLGQLYFMLPLPMLRKRLHGEEMAALAVKANNVLMQHPRWYTSVARTDSAATTGTELNSVIVSKRRQHSHSRRSFGRGRSFNIDLSPITE